jgi:Zn-dependent peptidase ImmA (M78 family)
MGINNKRETCCETSPKNGIISLMATTKTKTPTRMTSLYKRMEAAHFPRKYVKDYILPSWWDDSLAETETGYAEGAMLVARRCNVDIAALLDKDTPITLETSEDIRFKSGVNVVPTEMLPATHIIRRVAQLVLLATKNPLRSDLPTTAEALRQEILDKSKTGVVNLKTLLDWCWEAGIPVVYTPNLPPKKPYALCLRLGGRPIIFLCQKEQSLARQAFYLAHEIGHICLGHLPNEDSFYLESEEIKREDSDNVGTDMEEKQANVFAVTLLLGQSNITFTAPTYWNASMLAQEAKSYGKANRLDPATIVLNVEYHEKKTRTARNMAAVKLLEQNTSASEMIRAKITKQLDEETLSDEKQEFLSQIMVP